MRLRGQRGVASVELALVTPALVALIVGILQFGLWYHAEVVTRAAAMEAARVAAAEGATASDARARGMAVMTDSLGHIATGTGVSVTIGSETVRARVQARLRSIIPLPWLRSFTISSSAIAYREGFRRAGDR